MGACAAYRGAKSRHPIASVGMLPDPGAKSRRCRYGKMGAQDAPPSVMRQTSAKIEKAIEI
jgi:hypothetical protein